MQIITRPYHYSIKNVSEYHICWLQWNGLQAEEGIGLGSQVSTILAYVYMEHHEEREIREELYPPYIWLRYVEDTFTVLQDSEVDHLKSMYHNIKFTVDAEQNNTLAFLDTCICLKDDGSTYVNVYRKSTYRPVFKLGIKPPIRTQTLCGQDTLAKSRKFDIREGG